MKNFLIRGSPVIIFFFYCAHISIIAFAESVSYPARYRQFKAEAEKLHAEHSYQQAHDRYRQVELLSLPPAEQRWVTFRLADTLWRARAATQTADSSLLDLAQKQLETMLRDLQNEEPKDQIWAEIQESLGDFWWTRPSSRNWGMAWPYYQRALDGWAGAKNIALARNRYLNLIWTMSRPGSTDTYYYYGYYGNYVPHEVLENARQIAVSPTDQAHIDYLMAMTLIRTGNYHEQWQRISAVFSSALTLGKASSWYDDALFQYANWLETYGFQMREDNGSTRYQPDFVKALELYRKLIATFRKGETRFHDQAQQHIDNITKPVVTIGVSHVFLPDSKIQYYLTWRNVKEIAIAIYPVDLTGDLNITSQSDGIDQWLKSIKLDKSAAFKVWTQTTDDKGDYHPGQKTMRLDEPLTPGAYVIEARSGAVSARDLLLISDMSILLKTAKNKALVYVADALNGAPIPDAAVRLWKLSDHEKNRWELTEMTGKTNKDGLKIFSLPGENNGRILVTAAKDQRQAFVHDYLSTYSRDYDDYRIYAFTDRPAYRPGEQVYWKIFARRYDNSTYSTPASTTIDYEIRDPRNVKVKEDRLKLNAFGCAWDAFELTTSMPLGEYRITFADENKSRQIGQATLFRLEEYKLPEFKVTVQTPEENGEKKSFKLGETIAAQIQAEYYFGGPVANADVELIVTQKPFYHWWQPPKPYPWYYDRSTWPYDRYGQGQIIKRDMIKTDAAGKALCTFTTTASGNQDFDYHIEARVTDASRREIIGGGDVRVTRQRYYVYLNPEHSIYRPQDKVMIKVKALDANQQPQEAEGKITLTRDVFYEIWLDPTGREVRGDELKQARDAHRIFPPPPPAPDRKPWQLKFQGFQHDEILSRVVKTDINGEAEFIFTPEREGYYRVAWSSVDRDKTAITAETIVWAATTTTTDLQVRHGGLEIIVDKDTVVAGLNVPVMIIVPTNDRYVLFSLEGDDLYDYRLLHVTGTVKLIELPIAEQHVPNVFLNTAMIDSGQIFTDTKEVVVPPVQQFLEVTVTPDRELYQPREEGTLAITTRDINGNPMATELALGLVDASVFYIQQDYAGDPRQFYFGAKRQNQVQTQSSFQPKSYVKLIENNEKQLIDERYLQRSNYDQHRDIEEREHQMIGGKAGLQEMSADKNEFAKRKSTAAGAIRQLALSRFDDMRISKESDLPAQMADASGLAAAIQPLTTNNAAAVQVRHDFRSTIFWQPDIITDSNGQAVIKIKFPDSLTTWQATARAVTTGNHFGIATATMRTQQPLIVRLQAPRFFTVGDRTIISAVINNNTDKAMEVSTTLEAEGITISGLLEDGQLLAAASSSIQVGAASEIRLDWQVVAAHPGTAKLKVTSRAADYADAMEKSYPVYAHGIEKFVAKSGKLRNNEATIQINIPTERQPDSTMLTVQLTPSLAVTMLDALPYLIAYPYGCVEQTMSRFLPAAITAKTLRDQGIKPDAIMDKLFGGIESASASSTHPHGKANLNELEEMVKQGLKRLYDQQHSDGGWGWWKEGDSDHFMTAYVIWGLTIAWQAGITIDKAVLNHGVEYLDKEIVEEELNYDQQAWMLHALALYHTLTPDEKVSEFQTQAFSNLWNRRDQLNAYTRALLALSAQYFGYDEQAQTLVRNLENGAAIDHTPDNSVLIPGGESDPTVLGTAHWGEDGIYWRWSDGGVEATAFVLRALLTIDPQNQMIEPTTNWLIKNRRGAQWSNTRDTAIVILTLNDYLRTSNELQSDLTYELMVNDHLIATQSITPESVLGAPSRFVIDPEIVRDGVNNIHIVRKQGVGPLYYAVAAKFFSLEEPLTPAGNEIFVNRQYFKLVTRPTLLKGYVYEKIPLNDGESIRSGERVETVLTIDAKNNYEYLICEDFKPAGWEAVQIRSGEMLYAREIKAAVSSKSNFAARATVSDSDYTGRARWVYQELRDRQVALFVDKLPQGIWEIRYDYRAEVPGTFHALPVMGHAMYVPEIRANSAETRIVVEERKEEN